MFLITSTLTLLLATNSVGGNGKLMYAIEEDEVDLVKSLLETGQGDPYIRDGNGRTPLLKALAESRDEEIVRMLIEKKFNLNGSCEGERAIHLAVKRGLKSAVKALLTHDVDFAAPGPKRNTPLHLAVSYKKEGVFQLLLSKKPPLEEKNAYGETPLYMAVSCNRLDMAWALIGEQADIRTCDSRSNTLLHAAVLNGGMRDILNFLLKKNLPVEERNIRGETPLMTAVMRGKVWPVDTLIRSGARVDVVDIDGKSVLHAAASYMNPCWKLLNLFLEKGAEINLKDANDSTVFDLVSEDSEKALQVMEAGAEMKITEISSGNFRIFNDDGMDEFQRKRSNFDDYVIAIVQSYLGKQGEGVRDAKALIGIYDKNKTFAMYRIAKARYGNDGNRSEFERRKFVIFDFILVKLSEGTYAGILPVEPMADAVRASGYYWWKIEKWSVYLALASYNFKIHVDETFLTEISPFVHHIGWECS